MSDLRRWLSKVKPQRIKVEFADGDERTVRVNDARSRWRDAAEACGPCIRAEALADNGDTLGVWEAENAEELIATTGGANENAETVMLTRFAELLAEGADKAAARHENLVKVAFEQHAALVGVLSNRLAALEKAWHQLLMSQEPNANEDPNNALVTTLLGAALGAKPPAPPANGG